MGDVVPIINPAREIQLAAEELAEALARLDAARIMPHRIGPYGPHINHDG